MQMEARAVARVDILVVILGRRKDTESHTFNLLLY